MNIDIISMRPAGALSTVILAMMLLSGWAFAQSPTDLSNTPEVQQETENSGAAVELSDRSLPDLAAAIQRSLVIVRAAGRDGSEYGHGTGFVVSEEGLVATARHVIGDHRAVRVELPDGRTVPVTHIHSATEAVDVVVLQVDVQGLIPLRLGDDAMVKSGASVVAGGHPGSLKNSIFRGIVSGRQEIDGISMLQLAMTVEPGSSGEPVVDANGDVIGLVTLKSTETTNVGFAVPVSHLKQLLDSPTPIPMRRWMTIGALDAGQWETVFGGDWRQRAGRILVDGQGTSFGGRSLCIQTTASPELPFEIQVDVRMKDDSGAAGLIFHSDGKDRHYGFYPSNGNVRFTRFDGPTVYQWKVLHNEPHPAYRPDDWNTWKVRIEESRMLCFLNGTQVTEVSDRAIPPGRVGLATYRGTEAEFRRLVVAAEIPPDDPNAEQVAAMTDVVASLSANRPATVEAIEQLEPYSRFTSRFLADEARRLERRAERLKQLAVDINAAETRGRILSALQQDTPRLLEAAILIARLDNEEVDVASYIKRVDQLAGEVRATLADDASDADRLAALDKLLFEEYGFRGSRYEFYTRSNSYLNEVIDDREGLPITLSVLYMELARRLDLTVVGLGLPGHFVVRYEPANDNEEPQIIDVFNRGERLTMDDAGKLIQARQFAIRAEFFQAQSPQAIIRRMLINLLGIAESRRESERVLRYLETLVALDETDPEFRAKRLEIRARTGRVAEAIADVDWFLEEQPEGTSVDRLGELKEYLQQQLNQQTNEAR